MATPLKQDPFLIEKKRVLQDKVDISKKGSVDAPIVHLVQYINDQENYYTTSSCSGRILVFSEAPEKRKEGCHWLLVSHENLTTAQVIDVVSGEKIPQIGYVFFKFEPFVLHVACKCVTDAQHMVAISSGFKNSGLSISKKDKIIAAIRSTQTLQAPLLHNGVLLVSKEYINHLVSLANDKLADNFQRIQRFYDQLIVLHQSLVVKTQVLRADDKDQNGTIEKTKLNLRSQNEDDDNTYDDIAQLFQT